MLAGQQWSDNFDLQINNTDSTGSTSRGSTKLKQGYTFGLAWETAFQNQADQRIGFFVSHQQSEFEKDVAQNNQDIDVTHIHFIGTSYFKQGRWEPFITAGIGAGIYSPKDRNLSSETRLSAQIGGGTNWRLSDRWLLRFDVRWLPTFFNSGSAIFCSGGCSVRLNGDLYSQVQANFGLVYRY